MCRQVDTAWPVSLDSMEPNFLRCLVFHSSACCKLNFPCQVFLTCVFPAGMLYKEKKAMTIQYHPESSPGPHDADICFEQVRLAGCDACMKPAPSVECMTLTPPNCCCLFVPQFMDMMRAERKH